MSPFRIALAIAILVVLGGCAAEGPRVQAPPPFYTPSTAMFRPLKAPANRAVALNPQQILPGSEADDFFVPRGEKAVYGAVSYGGASAFTIYTYDAQAISTPHGSGYRYRWVVQQGITVP